MPPTGRRRIYGDDKRHRKYPLPQYDDATRVWHYHVLCRTCIPKGLEQGRRKSVPDLGTAVEIKRQLNATLARIGQHHRFVLEGCADPACP